MQHVVKDLAITKPQKWFSKEQSFSNLGETIMSVAIIVMCQNAESRDGESHINA